VGWRAVSATIALTVALLAASSVQAQDVGGPNAVQLQQPPLGVRPAEVVAAQVRSVLHNHRDGDAWRGLADALPELALQGGADLESTFEAARLAETMSIETATDSPATVEPAWLTILRTVNVELLGTVLALVTALIVVWHATRNRGAEQDPPQPTRVPVRFREAYALASRGRSTAEISRRTGLARDAVTVLIGMQDR